MLDGCPPWLLFLGGTAVGALPRVLLRRLRTLAETIRSSPP